MADRQKYYYLKIKENFFDSEDMKLLESMDNGYLYSNILMKMYLLSLKNGGKLVYKDKIPYNSKMLSTILNHNVDVLDKAIQIFQELGLIEILSTGEIFMLDIQNFIGKSSDEADRKRKYRLEIEKEKQGILEGKSDEDKCPDICRTNCSNIKDKDKDRDRDRDRDRVIIKDKDKDIIESFEKNYGRDLAPAEFEEIEIWKNNLLSSFKKEEIEKIICYAIKLSTLSGIKNLNYVKGILNNWISSNYTSYQDIIDNNNKSKKIDKTEENQEELFDYNWLDDDWKIRGNMV